MAGYRSGWRKIRIGILRSRKYNMHVVFEAEKGARRETVAVTAMVVRIIIILVLLYPRSKGGKYPVTFHVRQAR